MEVTEIQATEAQVTMAVSSIITIVTAIVITLSGCVAFLFKYFNDRITKKDDIIIDLTKSCIETNTGVKTALENNTKVIEKLPENILLRMKANGE